MTEKQKNAVTGMFDRIAGIYDLGNHSLSLGQDFLWRKKLGRSLAQYHPRSVLDLAAGTGDLAITIRRQNPDAEIVALDLARKMLVRAGEKIQRKSLPDFIFPAAGDIEQMPFPNQCFDAAAIAFGIRNLEQRATGLAEIFRILKPGGVFAILEFSLPEPGIFGSLYRFYLGSLLPRLGRILGGQSAYFYLRDTIREFPSPAQFAEELTQAGFLCQKIAPLSSGAVTLYLALRPE